MALSWTIESAKDKGARKIQEDRFFVWENPDAGEWLVVVSDGVGGHASGEDAAQAVIDEAERLIDAKDGRLGDPEVYLRDLAFRAHRSIEAMSAKRDIRARATVVALVIQGGKAFWMHSGDSRLYHFRGGELADQTKDHSVLQVLLDAGRVTKAEMEDHPDQGRLLQCLGGDEYKPPTMGACDVDTRDAFLLCTDGFWEKTGIEEIGQVLRKDRDLDRRLRASIGKARARGGDRCDNITAVAIVPKREAGSDGAGKRVPVSLHEVVLLSLMMASITCAIIFALWEDPLATLQKRFSNVPSDDGHGSTAVVPVVPRVKPGVGGQRDVGGANRGGVSPGLYGDGLSAPPLPDVKPVVVDGAEITNDAGRLTPQVDVPAGVEGDRVVRRASPDGASSDPGAVFLRRTNSVGIVLGRVPGGTDWVAERPTTVDQYHRVTERRPIPPGSSNSLMENSPIEIMAGIATHFCHKLTEMEHKSGALRESEKYVVDGQAEWVGEQSFRVRLLISGSRAGATVPMQGESKTRRADEKVPR
ncbi:MAG TPA: serine/threonine-protein phosphatase [Verrucomicrobiae bacterium]|nr:serine/threonine-protein phosphatase [Verrucomicrobiae bacterium]